MSLFFQLGVLLFSVVLLGCNSEKGGGLIGRAEMLPPPGALSAECEVDEAMSDEIAIQIAERIYEDSGVRTAGNSNVVQCFYKFPDLAVTVSHFEDVESCKVAYLKDGVGVAKKLEGYREFDEIGEDGYLTEFGGENFGFRYENLSVVVSFYKVADRNRIVKALKDYYASVVR